VVLLFLAREVITAVTEQDNVAQFAHIAGGVVGGAFGFVATRSRRRIPVATGAQGIEQKDSSGVPEAGPRSPKAP
jgi:hypothetical protein